MSEQRAPTSEEILIKSIINADVYSGHKHDKKKAPPVVAMYRDYGAGGDHIARRLAKILGVHIYDQEILDSVANAAGVDKELMAQLDDKVRHDRSVWVRGLFTTNTAYPENYRHHLVNVILGIAQNGGIIMGRGAHIILSDRKVFRVRVIGSPERCAERIAKREAMGIDSARVKVASINKERGEFLWNMFHERANDPSLFDLIINTDKFDSTRAAADLIMVAMLSMGFDVPEKVGE
jgi:cytidylate kinase